MGRSVELLQVLASTVIPGFSLLEIHDQNFYSPLDTYAFRNGTSSSTKVGSIFPCRCYVCCAVVSARVYTRCHSVQDTINSVNPLPLHLTFILGIRRFPVNKGLCCRLCLNLSNYSETAVSQPNGRMPDRRQV
jgi:hypothetical protein